jgi:hypothetical protein
VTDPYRDAYDKDHEYSALFRTIRRGSSFRQSVGSLTREKLIVGDEFSPKVNNSFIQP